MRDKMKLRILDFLRTVEEGTVRDFIEQYRNKLGISLESPHVATLTTVAYEAIEELYAEERVLRVKSGGIYTLPKRWIVTVWRPSVTYEIFIAYDLSTARFLAAEFVMRDVIADTPPHFEWRTTGLAIVGHEGSQVTVRIQEVVQL